MNNIKTIIKKQVNLYDVANRRYEELKKIEESKEASLDKAPTGKIHIINSNNHTQFYLRKDKTDTNGEYLAKSDKTKIGIYTQKAYDEKILKIVKEEIKVLNSFMRRSQNNVNMIQQVYSNYPDEVKKYVTPIDMSDEDFIKLWQSIPYEAIIIPEYIPVYETKKKERVRSKSELNIANALYEKGIPYKYEYPLKLKNGVIIHPDFTILNVERRKVIYWEHRGMMDDKDYARNSVQKMKSYMQNGFFLGSELIITEETSTNPLGTNEIKAVISKYLQNK